jgi:hypothetical protein
MQKTNPVLTTTQGLQDRIVKLSDIERTPLLVFL